MNLILLGEPGSGKGTQAEMLVKKLGLYYLQGGELAREWEEKVPEGENILFEGFPRFIPQFEDYEKWLNSKGSKIDAVISLDMSEDAAIKRLSSRRVCENCGEVYNLITNPPPAPDRCKCGGRLVQRKDDNPDSIKVRFQYYRNNTKKLIDYLESQGRLIKVDADRPIQIIFDEILEKLGVDND